MWRSQGTTFRSWFFLSAADPLKGSQLPGLHRKHVYRVSCLDRWLEGFWDRISLCSPDWPRTCDSPASASKCWDYRYAPSYPDKFNVFLTTRSRNHWHCRRKWFKQRHSPLPVPWLWSPWDQPPHAQVAVTTLSWQTVFSNRESEQAFLSGSCFCPVFCYTNKSGDY